MIRQRLRPNEETTRRALFVLLALAATALAIVGCSVEDDSRGPAPTAPRPVELDAGGPPSAPPSTPAHPDQSHASPAPAPAPSPAARKPATVSIADPESDVTVSVLVSAKEGGVIDAGRHRLTIPPGALDKDTIITLRDISGSAGYVACEALPEGLQFQRPVHLVTRFGDLKSPAGFTIYWIANPGEANENWVDTGATMSATSDGLTTWITHFSIYAPGKAGWGPRGGANRQLRPKG